MRITWFAITALLCAVTLASSPVPPSTPDEGMWTFDNPPLEHLEKKYGFVPSSEWLEHVMRASVRFNSGGSGSFVSPHGLVMTNHHVASDDLEKLSTAERDLLTDGFLARSHAEELPCKDLELNVLMSLEDVTARVVKSITEDMSEQEANEARKKAIAQITQEENERTGLRCDVVTLYQGARFALYRHKKYTDVRIVCAPEKQAAFFGGDPDNFTYPRFCLDFTFVRVYENGEPISSPAYFRWSASGAVEDELVFVSGNPGSTGRLDTVAKCVFYRDVAYPEVLKTIERRLAALRDYAKGGKEQTRQAEGDIFGLENAFKAYTGYLEGLRNEATMARKADEEKILRERGGPPAARALDQIAAAREGAAQFYRESFYSRLRGNLASTALGIVTFVKELEKPNEERRPPYQDAALESTRFRLFSPAPVYPGKEEVVLAASLREALENLGRDVPFVRATLGARSPEAVAHDLVQGTQLADVDFRRKLVDGGVEAVRASDDPMVQLAWKVQPIVRGFEDRAEEEIQSVETAAMEKVAKARFVVFGSSVAPDATFTLRLSYGTVKGYPLGTTWVPYKTNFYGLFARHAANDGQEPWSLSHRFLARRHRVDLGTPLNFVCTTDIIGGNSGSPVLNRKAEVVGLIFDGNIQSLGNRFVYDEKIARAVAVHSSGLIEALSRIYDAHELVAELTAH